MTSSWQEFCASWREEYSAQANEEGWDIFETDGAEQEPWKNDVLLICKCDDSKRFGTDEAALMHVIKNAREGSEMHKQALRLHMTLRPED